MGRLLELDMESDALELARNYCRQEGLILITEDIKDGSLIVMDKNFNTVKIFIKDGEWSL
ncbi:MULTISPECIES: hypothetical protein [Romboutsia]|uniref:Uncharacterized protein n=1 Tax=Romboutsia hominis TaxID=1507512 RepID=A0A2P2BX61_9FIRM|nr:MULTISPECIES: hypothetical protein [Romboutsia]MCH1961031.1 hypothetical protein [Romboutsia hominis]MCH1968538.1 hypothetical protein [Romboutsia hominis]MDB8790716.1 hypothetical protein [Romboutsia sp. 1001216sp1]MDB8792850.1 hypothetical protein [Romboutsia sp. 1001216sp1]MDB8795348.1 hypothetical protein [Romboutsia sp. 1001216sp1]